MAFFILIITTVTPNLTKYLFFTNIMHFYRVLTMVYSTQNYWGFGLFSFSGVFDSRSTMFQKLDLFPFSGERVGEDTYSVRPFRKS
jgi:hypothetical protein